MKAIGKEARYWEIIEGAKAVEIARRLDTVFRPRPDDLFLKTLEELVDARLDAQRTGEKERLTCWEAEMAWRIGEYQGEQIVKETPLRSQDMEWAF
ncbi:hypothetical protein ISS86_02035 [Candidatus Microgenomates bacterium]|nr:hypothetical protein [Candidatus Microgenomates bacterium]